MIKFIDETPDNKGVDYEMRFENLDMIRNWRQVYQRNQDGRRHPAHQDSKKDAQEEKANEEKLDRNANSLNQETEEATHIDLTV